MDFDFSPKVVELQKKVQAFMDEHIYPNEELEKRQIEANRMAQPPIMEELKAKAKAAGLWNLFLPESAARRRPHQPRVRAALRDHGALGHRARGVQLLRAGHRQHGGARALRHAPSSRSSGSTRCSTATIRSAFAMTEPDVASSDATNIRCEIRRDGDDYVINGRKWWTSGVLASALQDHDRDGQDRIPTRRRTSSSRRSSCRATRPGVKVLRHLPVFGYDDAPHGHGEVLFEDVRVPASNILLGEGRGFEIAQGRLGPGRIHHCMRVIGVAERALEAMCKRVKSRVAFGKPIAEQTVTLERIAESRIDIEQARLLTLKAAYMMDTVGNKVARKEIAMIKVAAPNMALRVDRLGHPGPRRRRRLRRLLPRPRLREHAHAAPGRRPRRGAPQPDRQAGAAGALREKA